MQLDPARTGHLASRYHHLKTPAKSGPPAQRDPKVIETVSRMLSEIEQGGMDRVLAYAATLDRWDGRDPELSAADIERLIERLPAELRQALDLGQARTREFAALCPGEARGLRGGDRPRPGHRRALRAGRPRRAPTCRPAGSRCWPARS